MREKRDPPDVDVEETAAQKADRRASYARAEYVKTRLWVAKRVAEERERWLLDHPVLPRMTQEQRSKRAKDQRAAFARIDRIFQDLLDSADRGVVDDLRECGRLPAELQPDYVPKIRLDFWGRCIRTQRVNQRLKAKDFCRDLGVSEATLRRVEKGDPMVSVISYMRAMGRLGILTRLVPEPPEDLWRVEDEWLRYCYRSRRSRDVPYCKVRRVRDSSPD